MRASPRKGRLRLEEETKLFLKNTRRLSFLEELAVGKERSCEVSKIDDGGSKAVGGLECERSAGDDTSMVDAQKLLEPVLVTQESALNTFPGETLTSNFSFTAMVESGVSKGKIVKVKSQKKKVADVENKGGVIIKQNEVTSGDKRKWPDLMIVNEDICDDLAQKRLKGFDNVDGGSSSKTVEAEVGKDQPRRAL